MRSGQGRLLLSRWSEVRERVAVKVPEGENSWGRGQPTQRPSGRCVLSLLRKGDAGMEGASGGRWSHEGEGCRSF